MSAPHLSRVVLVVALAAGVNGCNKEAPRPLYASKEECLTATGSPAFCEPLFPSKPEVAADAARSADATKAASAKALDAVKAASADRAASDKTKAVAAADAAKAVSIKALEDSKIASAKALEKAKAEAAIAAEAAVASAKALEKARVEAAATAEAARAASAVARVREAERVANPVSADVTKAATEARAAAEAAIAAAREAANRQLAAANAAKDNGQQSATLEAARRSVAEARERALATVPGATPASSATLVANDSTSAVDRADVVAALAARTSARGGEGCSAPVDRRYYRLSRDPSQGTTSWGGEQHDVFCDASARPIDDTAMRARHLPPLPNGCTPMALTAQMKLSSGWSAQEPMWVCVVNSAVAK